MQLMLAHDKEDKLAWEDLHKHQVAYEIMYSDEEKAEHKRKFIEGFHARQAERDRVIAERERNKRSDADFNNKFYGNK
jgi:hypothetical protein